MIIFLLQTPEMGNSIVDWVQKLGLPTVMVLGLLLFLYKVWQHQSKKLDEAHSLIKDNAEQSRTDNKEFRSELLNTQSEIVKTQNNIVISQNNITRTADDIKQLIERTR